MTKPDDARIERLTALARKVWHHEEEQPVTVERGLRGCDPATAFVRTGNGIVLDIAAPNDRALDALEAALRVLAGVDDVNLGDPVPEPGGEVIATLRDRNAFIYTLETRIAELEALLAKAGETITAAMADVARMVQEVDVCEVCGDCLEPQPVRCERHVNTERGDPEWTYEPEGT